jgi:hypothetical protein
VNDLIGGEFFLSDLSDEIVFDFPNKHGHVCGVHTSLVLDLIVKISQVKF